MRNFKILFQTFQWPLPRSSNLAQAELWPQASAAKLLRPSYPPITGLRGLIALPTFQW